MKFAIIALLGVASPLVQALAVEARAPEKPVPTFVFHNEKGEVVGERVRYLYLPNQSLSPFLGPSKYLSNPKCTCDYPT